MTKQLTLLAAGCVLAASAQQAQNPQMFALQQSDWFAVPGHSASSVHMNPVGQSGPVLGRPYSATEVRKSEQKLENGTSVTHDDTGKFYRDAQGRMRAESSTQAIIYDPVAGFLYSLNLKSMTYDKSPFQNGATVSIAVSGNTTSSSSSYHSSNGKPAAIKPPDPPAGAVTEDLAPQTVNGIFAKGARVTTTIPAGKIGNDHDLKVVNERWYSDDLQVIVKSSNSDPRFGSNSYELTNILQAPPDPSLFEIPITFKPSGHKQPR